jgi:hypothetical protein
MQYKHSDGGQRNNLNMIKTVVEILYYLFDGNFVADKH